MIASLVHNDEFKMPLSYMCYYHINTPFGIIFQDSFVTQGENGNEKNNKNLFGEPAC